jgi:UDP:flavonoid glycosyltransferase YjiC (YdhE family)
VQTHRPVILLVAEAVTLAHYARIVALAGALDRSKYEVVVATDRRFAALGRPAADAVLELESIPSAAFAEALAHGRRVYDAETLARYAQDDLALIRRVRPDLIVGDFRLSLAASAPASGVRYACVVNAYWSPYADVDYPVPDLPLTRALGVTIAQKLFDVARKRAFASHARPVEQLRKRYGLPALDGDMRTAYTWGDHTLYADLPDYVPMRALPANHRHLGPPLWSVDAELPEWWNRLPDDKPRVLVTLGTSGSTAALPVIVARLASRPVTVIVATAHGALGRLPSSVHAAPYLPFDAVARRCALVVCNGGSLATYGASVAGVPVLGICTNMDQLLNMQVVTRLGTGIALRASERIGARFDAAVSALLDDPRYRQQAARLGERVGRFDPAERFREFVTRVVRDGP